MAEYTCPHCKKPIYDDDALLCLYCGQSLSRGAGLLGNLKYPKLKIIIIALVFLVLLTFIILIVI